VGRRRLALAAAAGERDRVGCGGGPEAAWPVPCGDPVGAQEGAAPGLRAPEVFHWEVGRGEVWPTCHRQCSRK
jgi:hypothetical protein